LAVCVQAAQNFDGDIFNLINLNDMEVRKQYQTHISNMSTALENLTDSDYINRALENIKENIKPSAKDSLVLH
jgi:hypothetical protein